MNLKQCEEHLNALDATVIGVDAHNPISRACISDDDSIILCKSRYAMSRQCTGNGPYSYCTRKYGELIADMVDESITYHMDSTSFERFRRVWDQDFRFYPEIIHFEESDWVTVCSSFNMISDDKIVLFEEIDSCVIGYRQPNGSIIGARPGSSQTGEPIYIWDIHYNSDLRRNLDGVAICRLQAVDEWVDLMNQLKWTEEQ